MNDFLEKFDQNWPEEGRLPPFTEQDLRKVAFWTATGSGKTLLMHVHTLQFRDYARRYGRVKELNRILLLTPSETLSRQHLVEFSLSGLPAENFSKDYRSLLAGDAVEILEVYRLKEEAKEKTVAVDAFERNNLVLVDEGHRGAKGYEWKDKRDQLSEEGFCFEYSATFGQAVSHDRVLYNEYAKAILLDYSYRRFHRDGFGKDFRILNLSNDRNTETRSLYLTACLLTYYQQLRVFLDHRKSLHKYQVQKPLWILVGSTVTGGKVVPDVVEVLKILSSFTSDRSTSVAQLQKLLSGRAGLLDDHDREVFSEAFSYVRELRLTPGRLFDEILAQVFHANQPGPVHVEPVRDGGGEIRLRAGPSDDAFGLINVGDVGKLCDLCEAQEELVVAEPVLCEPTFDEVGNGDSQINVLIGAKKFTEGWNSWRVSTMGLLNVGRGEGSEIIQLFGRGVRLQGLAHCLKRSAFTEEADSAPDFLRLLETLYVFGVRADYMEQFREFLLEEGVPIDDTSEAVTLPVIVRPFPKGLKVIQAKPGAAETLRSHAYPLEVPPEGTREKVVTVDWYSRLDLAESNPAQVSVTGPQTGVLGPDHLLFLDTDALFLELQRYKAERGWHQLLIDRDILRPILSARSWYRLLVPPSELEFTTFEKTEVWQEMALTLLKKYASWFVKYRMSEAQRPFLEYQDLTTANKNILSEYRVEVPAAASAHLPRLRDAESKLRRKEAPDATIGNITLFTATPHLYQPLVSADKTGDLRVIPTPLNDNESHFVKDLARYLESRPVELAGMSVHLLRNQSRGRGLAVFAHGNFYPDFLLWVVRGERQFLTFVDPHGLVHCQGIDDPKIRFHEEVKSLQALLGNPNVVLSSFVVSPTPFDFVSTWRETGDKATFLEHGVVFQRDDPDSYIETLVHEILR
ncbi:MAG: DEAD/DEAH box helicase family protein [Nitrososphaerota archaeon]|nr:DEAD/DEAH box helicase family protein [Nitrososphaerota archaeon]